jgi:hypothetical protein
MRRYDKFAEIDVGERLIQQLKLVPEALLQSPLLVALLYRTFGVNNAISDRVTAFYGDTYEALYKGHDLTKTGFSRPKRSRLDVDAFRRVLRAVAFYTIASGELGWPTENALIQTIENAMKFSASSASARSFAEDLLTAVPLLVRDGGEIRFVHKTFAEYFAAEFIAHSPDAEKLLRQVRNGPVWRSFTVTFDHIGEMAPALARRVFHVPVADAVLATGIDGQMSLEDMCLHCFEWRMSWLDRANTSPDVPSWAEIDGKDYVRAIGKPIVHRRPVVLHLLGTRASFLERAPDCTLKQLSRPVSIAQPSSSELGEGRRLLGVALAKYPTGQLLSVGGSELAELLKNTYFRTLAASAVQVLMGGQLKTEGSIGTLDARLCKAVIETEERELRELATFNELLTLAKGE